KLSFPREAEPSCIRALHPTCTQHTPLHPLPSFSYRWLLSGDGLPILNLRRSGPPNPQGDSFSAGDRKEVPMLILTRKIDQSIIIQGNITVMILGVERDRVKLGIAAPEDVTVLREELVDATRADAP